MTSTDSVEISVGMENPLPKTKWPSNLGNMKMIEKIQKLLHERGWSSQEGFEKSAGLAKNRISKWAGGTGEPTARQAWRMATLLGVSVDYLVRDDLNEPTATVGLSEDERMVLRTMRAVSIDADEVIRLIYSESRDRSRRTIMEEMPPLPPPKRGRTA